MSSSLREVGRFTLWVTLCLATSVTSLDAADVFYVDNGRQSNCVNSSIAGSESAPWCTIAYGIARLNGGDTLYVKNGTYAESLYDIAGPSGSAGNPTIISAYPGHMPVIDNDGAGRVHFNGVSHMTFRNFVVTDVNQGIFVSSSDHVTIEGNTIHGIQQEAVHVRYDSSFVTLSGNVIYNIGLIDANGEGIYVGTGSGGPKDNTHQVRIVGNVIRDTTDECIELKPGTHDSIVDGNVCERTGTDLASSAVGHCVEFERGTLGVQSWSQDPAHVIRNNVCASMGTAIRIGSGSAVYNNVIFDLTPGHYGIRVENRDADAFPRSVYHNTIDVGASANAVSVLGGATDIRNNIGPSGDTNLAPADSYFVGRSERDYRLVAGSEPVNRGADLTAVVATDIDGRLRAAPDIGAYELAIEIEDTEPPTVVITSPAP